VVLVLGILTPGLRWLMYPHVNITIFNESSAAIADVRITFLYGERTCERIEPGGVAATEIQSGGDAGVFISYRGSTGVLRNDEILYYSDERGSPDRGWLEVHVTDEGKRLVKGIYTAEAVDIPILTFRVRPTGRMVVK
jgi:hypothetical protein